MLMPLDWKEEHYNVRRLNNCVRIEVSQNPTHNLWYVSISDLVPVPSSSDRTWRHRKGSSQGFGGDEHRARDWASRLYASVSYDPTIVQLSAL